MVAAGAPIHDVEVPPAVNREVGQIKKLRLRRRPAVPAESPLARSRYRRDHPRLRVHLPHPLVSQDVEVPPAINREASRAQLRLRRRPAVPAESLPARSRYRRDHPRLPVHLPHPGVVLVRDVEVPRAVNREASHVIQLRLRRQPAVPAESPLARSRYRRDHPRLRSHLPHPMVSRDVEVPRAVYR